MKYFCKPRQLSSLTIVYTYSGAIRKLFLIDWFFTRWPFLLRLSRSAHCQTFVFIRFIYILLKRKYTNHIDLP